MRTASFLILSVSLHAAALAFPITFAARSSVEPIRVTILPPEPEQTAGQGSGNRNVSKPANQSTPRPAPQSNPAALRIASRALTIAPQAVGAATEVATANDSHVLWNAVGTELASDHTDAFAESLIGAGHGGGETRGTGGRSNGIGAGTGSGAGSRSAAAGSGGALIQASYRDTPRPEYPDSARREGREGRVLLRVLIDDQGRTKAVEINTSSGSSILDRAAADAIRRWRFHPARYGDQPIESWLRIPIEFRLADANPW